MRGVILAGGLGSRLFPLTRITNKHLLPVYDKPMIYYPVETLVNIGIREILIVTGGNNAGDFLKLLRNGKGCGLDRMHYAYQEGEGGIADALGLAETFAEGGSIVVMLGDNIIEGNIVHAAEQFRAGGEKGGRILLKEVDDPERFGVPELSGDKIARIIEKPESPPSRYAVTGVYFYDNRVFDVINGLSPSDRGELEITDVNNKYIEWGEMEYDFLEGWWTDAGTFESLFRASKLIRSGGANHLDFGQNPPGP